MKLSIPLLSCPLLLLLILAVGGGSAFPTSDLQESDALITAPQHLADPGDEDGDDDSDLIIELEEDDDDDDDDDSDDDDFGHQRNRRQVYDGRVKVKCYRNRPPKVKTRGRVDPKVLAQAVAACGWATPAEAKATLSRLPDIYKETFDISSLNFTNVANFSTILPVGGPSASFVPLLSLDD